jgi:hypothetical protein
MSPSRPGRSGLRKREIAFAVAMGALAAGGAALVLTDGDGDDFVVPALAGPNELTYDVAPFEGISTTGPQDVVVTRGETISVRSEGSPDALALLEAVVEDGKLVIRPKRQLGPFGDWGRLQSATFYVTMPRLDTVALAGSGDVRIDRVEGEEFAGSIAGPGELSIGALDVDEADFRIGGSGNLVVSGRARETGISIGGSGEVDANGLRSETASVSIGGSGDVALTVESRADVSIMGSGDVAISGPARCSVTQMGSGDVRCEGGGGTD